MKTRLQTTSVGMALAATMLLGTMGCNDDWGQKDPEAGNQVFPTLSTVATIAFEDESGAHALPAGYADKAFAADATAEVLDDDVALSPVLSLNNAVASFNNPLNDSKCQTGVSFSFWMRQPLEKDEEGNVIGGQDLRTPIIAFVNPRPADAVEPDAPAEGGEDAQSREGEGEGEGEGDEPSTDEPSTDEPSTDEPAAEENPYEVYGTLAITANGMIKYDADNGLFSDNDPDQFLTGYITPDEWHFVAVNIYDEGYAIYVDGMRKVDKYVPNFNCHKMVEFANNAKLIYLNGTPDSESAPALNIDDLTLARNNFTAKEIARPKKGNIGVEPGAGGGNLTKLPDPIYFNNFEYGMNGATIQGAGSIVDEGGVWGKVFQNVGGESRKNFLRLPDDCLMRTGETNEMTVSFWVNAKNAGAPSSYMWSPIFTAYSDYTGEGNHAPLFACYYRGGLAVNMNGADNAGGNWCDFVDAQCTTGTVQVRHDANDWLADHDWHMYTVIFTKNKAEQYFDDELINAWEIDGTSDGQRCEIFGDARLSVICLGGNQSWWSDPDIGAAFDDVKIYNQALTSDQVSTLYALKTQPQPVYFNNFEYGMGGAKIQGAGTITSEGGLWGNTFQNVGGEVRKNFLRLPDDCLMRTGETNEMTATFWVNAKNAGAPSSYMWSPIFTAYSDYTGEGNHAPLFACYYRGGLAVNMNGADNAGGNWCDFVDAQCTTGTVQVRHDANDWLADHEWHMYTVIFTKNKAEQYFDDELINAWEIDGTSDGQRCEIFGDARLSVICLGGNQSWWSDPDIGAAFDDVRIYNRALTEEEISVLRQIK